jgi:hypothetical protein
LIGAQTPALSNDRPQPIREITCPAQTAAEATEIEMSMRINQAGEDGSIPEVDIGFSLTVGLDRHNPLAMDRDHAALYRGTFDREDPPGGQTPR